MSLRTRLYLLVLLLFVPVGILIFFTAEEQKKIEKDTIWKNVLMLARVAADEEQQQLDATRNFLVSISDQVLLADEGSDRWQVFFSNARNRSQGYADLGIIDPEGRLIAHGQSSEPAPIIDFKQRPWFLACIEKKTLAMGDYQGEHVNGEPVLYFALPVLDAQQRVKAVIFAAVNLNWMNRTTFKLLAELPRESRLSLIDEGGGVLSYDGASKKWSRPDRYRQRLSEDIVKQRSGIATHKDQQGVWQIYAFTPLVNPIQGRRVYVILEMPEKVALAASRKVFMRNMAVLLLFGLLAVLSVWWAGDMFFIRRVRTMARASRGIAAGDLSTRVGDIGGRDELSHLAGVFDEMAAALQVRQTRERQVMAALQQSQTQLRNLSTYQQQVREKERIRIAREIHDAFGQSLTILKMDLAWLKKQLSMDQTAALEKIGTMFQVIDASLKILHTVMADLRPVILDDFGLAAAIEWQAEEFGKRTGIPCQVEIRDISATLSKEVATAVFRIFQELLTNIIRHAKADNVRAGLLEQEGRLILRVMDDGRGISEAEINNPGSFGVIGIRERLYPWNGTVTFEGRPGQGTQVTVAIPLQSEEGTDD